MAEGRVRMKIIDAHCDALLKLVRDDKLSFYDKNDHMHVQYTYIEKANVALQAFAIFVSPKIPVNQRFDAALDMADKYYEKVICDGRMQPVCSSDDLAGLFTTEETKHGAILTLEGADALEGNIVYLRTLYRLGVRALGLTWNHRNEAADGVEEPNPGGLSIFGRQVVAEANRLGIIIDVSHLAEKGFWDVIEYTQAPIMASHSNCKSIYPHRRNLSDEQLRALFQIDGVVGLTFVPQFISNNENVTIKDLLRHLEHILALGGEDHVAFGSDFDGIDTTMVDLKNTSFYNSLVESLLKNYKEAQVEKWLTKNWYNLFGRVLK
jgi:membrane dipeptidase